MEFLGKHQDLKESLTYFSNMINHKQQVEQENVMLKSTMSKLGEELDNLKLTTAKLRDNTSGVPHSDAEPSICSLYLDLKGQYSALEEKFNNLRKELDEMQAKHQQEVENTRAQFVHQIKSLETQLTLQDHEAEEKQRELQNELAAQQAALDIRFDEMQSQLQTQNLELSKKLHESTQGCARMRDELLMSKNSSNARLERIQDLENQLLASNKPQQTPATSTIGRTAIQAARSLHEFNPERDDTYTLYASTTRKDDGGANRPHFVFHNKPSSGRNISKYSALDAERPPEERAVQSRLVPAESIWNNPNRMQRPNKHVVPLKPVSSVKPKGQEVSRKRKLFNPDSCDFLAEMDDDENY